MSPPSNKTDIIDSAAYAAMYAQALDAVMFTTPGGRILAANPAACELLRMTEDEICRRGRRGIADPADPRWQVAVATRQQTGKVRAELSMRRGDGTRFVADLSSAVFTDVSGEERTCTIFRDITPRWWAEQRLRAANELSRALLAGAAPAEAVAIAAKRARQTLDASHGGVLTVGEDPGWLVVTAAIGPGVEPFVGTEYRPGTLAGSVMKAGTPVGIQDLSTHPGVSREIIELGLGPALLAPMMSADRCFGVLAVARPVAASPFGDDELQVIGTFAESAAIALAYGEARADAERLAVLADQDRIARDLHDRVIQQLFAIGLNVQAAQRLAVEKVAERLGRAVADIDDTIIDVRATVYDLQPPRKGTLVSEVHALAAEAGEILSFQPRVAFHGRVHSCTPVWIMQQLLTVLREALSNVIRHAQATEVDVTVKVNDEVALTVADNGVGIAEWSRAGNGMRNMTQRARALGGDLLVTPARPTGTVLHWRAPLPSTKQAP